MAKSANKREKQQQQHNKKKMSFRERCVNALGMRGYIFSIMVVTCLLMLIVLWLFQVVYLEKFYETVKTRQIHNAAETLTEHIDSDDFDTIASDLAQSRQICMLVYSVPYPEVFMLGLQLVYSADVNSACAIHPLGGDSLEGLYNLALKNGGTYTEPLYQQVDSLIYSIKSGTWWDRFVTPNQESVPDSLVYVTLVTNAEGVSTMIILNSNITPMSATIAVIRSQLIFVTAIVILLALILSTAIARYLAKPITDLTASAGKLATGDFETKFATNGYREIGDLADALNYAAAELGRAGKLQQDVLANISHDLRTPLTMIGGYAEFMRDFPDEDHAESINVIISESERLSALIRDVLDYSKLQSGVEKMEMQHFDFTGTMREFVGRYHSLMEKDGYSIEFEADDDVIVYGDEQRLCQAVGNMINNAITHCGEDKKVVVRQQIGKGTVRIEIADNGGGIAENDLKQIWQRYYHTDAPQRATKGSGLGLSIVQGILELHGARYGVESELGEGATFWFVLPYIDEEENSGSPVKWGR